MYVCLTKHSYQHIVLQSQLNVTRLKDMLTKTKPTRHKQANRILSFDDYMLIVTVTAYTLLFDDKK